MPGETAITTGQGVMKFGTKDFDHTTYGKCTDISFKPITKKTEVTDGEDNVVGVIFTDIATEVSANFEPLAGATLTEDSLEDLLGAELEIGSNSYYIIEPPELKYTAGKAATFNVKGRTLPQMPTATPST